MTRILPMTSLVWPSCSTSTIEAPGVLEPVLDLGTLPAGGRSLVEGGLALFGSERGQGHGGILRRRSSGGVGESSI